MRISWLLPNLHPTGGSRNAVEISKRMVERGHSVTLLIPDGRLKLPIPDGITVIECGLPIKNPMVTIPFALVSMYAKIPRSDVVIGSMPPYALLASKVARYRNVVGVNFLSSDDLHFFDDRDLINSELLLLLYRAFARRSLKVETIFANSHWTASRCVSCGGAKPDAIIQPGYDQNAFYPVDDLQLSDTPVILAMGRKGRAKGMDDLLTALDLVYENGNRFILQLISQHQIHLPDKDYPVKVLCPTTDDELRLAYQKATVFVFPSWAEGFGLPPLEAMACGTCVVSTDCGGVREFLIDNYNSQIVNPREPKSLAKALMKVLSNNVPRTELCVNGLDSIKRFTWDITADKFEHALNRLIN